MEDLVAPRLRLQNAPNSQRPWLWSNFSESCCCIEGLWLVAMQPRRRSGRELNEKGKVPDSYLCGLHDLSCIQRPNVHACTRFDC